MLRVVVILIIRKGPVARHRFWRMLPSHLGINTWPLQRDYINDQCDGSKVFYSVSLSMPSLSCDYVFFFYPTCIFKFYPRVPSVSHFSRENLGQGLSSRRLSQLHSRGFYKFSTFCEKEASCRI